MRLRSVLLPLGAAGLMAVGGAHGPGMAPGHLGWPLGPGWVLTQPYGCTPFLLEPVAPWCPTGHFHSGVDMAAPFGTPVRAAAAGIAQVAEMPYGYGLYVVIDHGGGLATLYGHLGWTSLTTGDSVTAGRDVGEVGSSGLSTGPHLHFEVRRNGRPVDPIAWLPATA
jgi:murein DD-endopeptidase MepM/ murein hydrolase activator NlpD